MELFQKLAKSLSDITEEDVHFMGYCSSKLPVYSNLILPSRLYKSWKSMIDYNLSQQRSIHLRQFHNYDTTYLLLNLWHERSGTGYKVNQINCNLEYSLSMHGQNGNDIMNNNSSNSTNINSNTVDNNDSNIIEGIDETTGMTCFIPQTAIRIFISPQNEECLTSSPLPLEEHQEDSGIENNCRSSSIDDHSPAASVDFYPSIELNQLNTRNSFASSLSPSPPNHQQYCYQHFELSSPSILSSSILDHTTVATEDSYLTPSTSKLLRTNTITKADLPEQVNSFTSKNHWFYKKLY
ncbi:hypothetical protein LOAG_13184 [Loa loa]|uniref:Uncharacterized protein n=1 Tax=Loa loa TaxID=7209 RepID=A0A1S0TJV2_LOALO|nr:hypothetical protein LOAG_13184 [Loa loa]EFO15327.1 hypothetical protein LOAG_13184 [Loa loa]